MIRSGRRHLARPVSALRAVVLWAIPALVLAGTVLVYAGVPVVRAVAGCAGLLVLLLVVYALDRSGVIRPPEVHHRPGQAPARPHPDPDDAASGGDDR